ncbi:MAG: hypothetical protein IJM24_00335 [Clostridia bacterium]|nr:hypothetical protein [Clostridia bacterium]
MPRSSFVNIQGAFSRIVFPENRTKNAKSLIFIPEGRLLEGSHPGKSGENEGVERISSVHGSVLVLKIARAGAERRKKAPNELNEVFSDPVLTRRRPKNEREIAQKIEKPVFC